MGKKIEIYFNCVKYVYKLNIFNIKYYIMFYFLTKILNLIYNLNNSLLDNNLSYNDIMYYQKKTIFEPEYASIRSYIKDCYKSLYYIGENLLTRLSHNDILDKQQIQKILDLEDLDMSELRTKTSKILINDPDSYYWIMRWIAGNCWSNALITNGYKSKLTEEDYNIISSINKTIGLIEPMDKSLILFHGFEKFSNYNEKQFEIGKNICFPGILSKTTCFTVAELFATTQNFYQPKYFVIKYPPGSRHVGLNIKPVKHDEYEYIGKSDEKFKLEKICKIFNGLQMQIFYICSIQN